MTKKFLRTLFSEDKLRLVNPSENISKSYMQKSNDSFKSAKLLLENKLFENSISMSYYAMYNVLLALLFRIGIKSENHTGSIILLDVLFSNTYLYHLIYDAKKERIDKQYYVSEEKEDVTEDVAKELLSDAENFVLDIKLLIKNLSNENIENYRINIENLLA